MISKDAVQKGSPFSILFHAFRPPYLFLILLFSMMSMGVAVRGQSIPKPGAIAPYLDGVFPDQTPGPSGTWEVVNAFPNLTFIDPVQLLEVPGQNNLLVASKTGALWILENDPSTSAKTLLLDIENQVYTADDCGLLGVAFHPEFGQPGSVNRGYLYIYYRYTTGQVDGEKAYLRLSRFELADGASTIDPNTEYVLIQQYDQHRWHNGGGMFFGSDGFLYVTVGDEGGANDFFNSTQAIDKWLFGGILRLDVDRDSTRSHPIRRQPISNATPPAGWPGTYTQGYFIPNDNPWQDTTGGTLEEFYAIGLRSPHRMTQDPITGDIWIGDIGQGLREEVDKVAMGDNMQWPYREGDIEGPKAQPDSLIGNDRPPVYSYGRQLGTSVIGGFVYRGAKFPSLVGKYIFGDHTFRSVWALEENVGDDPTITDLVSVPSEGVGNKNGISSFGTDSNGEVYVLKLFGTDLDGGKVLKLQQNGIVADPPALLSQTGAFVDMVNLTPDSGIIPYLPNATLWSDKAEKFRWVAIPNDGAFDSADEQVVFHAATEWDFPPGTVFIKHFELPIDEANPHLTKRLETRFFVLTADGRGYGVSYQWNDQGTDAVLLSDGATKEVTITQEGGSTYTQTWTYPSRQQCMTCHNDASQYVLGLKTHQLNGDVFYPSAGTKANQLSTWNSWGVFDTDIGAHTQYLKSFHITDTTASLAGRVRSYLDANCAFCHRPNYVQGAFDARFTSPLENQNLVNGLNISSSSVPGGVIIKPGSPHESELWIRDQSTDGNQMPPLARDIVDATYIEVLEEWIYSLAEADTTAPSVPENLILTEASGNTLSFSWQPSVDDVGVAGYRLFVQLGETEHVFTIPYSPFVQTYTVPNLLSDTTFQVRISAWDESGNESERSEAVSARTLSCGFTIQNLLIAPISDCNAEDGSLEVEVNGSGLEYSLDRGVSFQSSPFFTGLTGGTYTLLVRSISDTTCTLTQEFVILDPAHCPVCSPSPNLALGKVATQSSTYGDGLASLAVDGNTVGDNPWGENANLQHTQTDSAAWWKVDLDTLYNLDYLKIYNRSDFGGFKLNNFYLYLSEYDIEGELSHADLQADPAISFIHYPETAGEEETISLEAQHARYLMIKLSASEFLHMAEVEIYGCEIVSISDCGLSIDSLAVTLPNGCEQISGSIEVNASSDPSLSNQLIYSLDSGLTYQYSNHFNELAAGTYYLFMRSAHDASCEVEYVGNPIVLTDTSSIQLLDITSTPVTDCDMPNGMATINATGDHLAYSIDGGIHFQVSPHFSGLGKGRYPVVVRDSLNPSCQLSDTLNIEQSALCDTLPCIGGVNVALGKYTTQSSTYGDGHSSLAVDGNTTGSTPWGSSANLAHPQTSHDPWWKVDLGSIHSLDSIRIFNRTNCCTNRLRDFYVFISSSEIDASHPTDSLLSDSSITSYFFPGNAASLTFLSFSGQEGRYLALKLPGVSQTLHFAEFEAYGCRIEPTCSAQIDSIAVFNPTECGQMEGSAWVQASGDSLEYSLDGGVSYQPSPSFPNLGVGTYTVFVREVQDTLCITADTFSIKAISPPLFTAIEGTNPTDCGAIDGRIYLQAEGDSLEYSINGGISYQLGGTFEGLEPGTYQIAVREVSYPTCVTWDSVHIPVIEIPVIQEVMGVIPSGCGLADGSMSLLASGDSLLYSIDGGLTYQSSPEFQGLPGGEYEVYVRELLYPNCVATTSYLLETHREPSIDSIRTQDPASCEIQDGFISILATGDSLAYSIDGGNTYQLDAVFEGLPGATYEIVVRELLRPSCRVEATATLLTPTAPVIDSIQVSQVSSCDTTDGSIHIQATGDSLAYSIDGGNTYQQDAVFEGLAGATYEIVVREVLRPSCRVEATATLFTPTVPVIDSIQVSQVSSCDTIDGSIHIQATGNSLAYSIDGGNSYQLDAVFEGLAGATYEIVVREVLRPSCQVEATAILLPPTAPVIDSVQVSQVSSCDTLDGSIRVHAKGDSLEYSIDGGNSYQLDAVFEGLAGATYEIVVREVLRPSCQVEATAILLPPTAPVIDSVQVSQVSSCDTIDGSIHIQATGDSLEYSIDGGNSYQLSPEFTGLDSGSYIIFVREVGKTSCIDSLTTSIYPAPPCEDLSCELPTNIALGKPASQSSTYGNGVAGIAVDGELAGDTPWGEATLQHTSAENSPWWQVDLEAPARLDSFRVFNRTDCCQGRLKNFYVFVSKDSLDGNRPLPDLLADSTVASFFYPSNPGNQASIDLRAVHGQFVLLKLGEGVENLHTSEVEVYGCYGVSTDTDCTVQIDSVLVSPPSDCGINDAQVQVFAAGEGFEYSIDGGESFQYSPIFSQLRPATYSVTVRKITQWTCSATQSVVVANLPDCGGDNCDAPINLALGKLTFQSSTYGNGLSDHAVDGNTTGSSPWGEAADLQHTAAEDNPWWKVDLGETATLSEVQLFNRSNCCQNRLKDFYVFTSLEDIDGTKSVDSLISDPTIQYLYFSGRAGLVESIDLEQVQGRFLLLKLEGENKTLHTAEIEVYGCTASPSQRFLNPNDLPVWTEQGETLNARVQPNPFEGTTEVRWDREGDVKEVYITNTLGQTVWRGRGNEIGSLVIGEELSMGVYWVHIHGVTETQIIKILKVN